MAVVQKVPTLYDFLLQAELSHYFTALKNDLKVTSVPQLKYVEEDDLLQMGMTKPEMRRLRKYFNKYCPQNYLHKIRKMILPHSKDDPDRLSMTFSENSIETNMNVASKHIIPMDSIVINKELGVGEFGVVQQGVWTNEEGMRIQVAIKCLSEERMQNNHMEFLKEAAIMHTIDNENIVRLYGVVLETHALMLVTELAPLRSLLECLKEPMLRPSFPVISLSEFALQISEGMMYLEGKKLIHRDLAARNILVFGKNKVKVSDFGLSRALGVGKDYYQSNFNVNLKLPIAWCAPECINYLRFTSSSDVWAYGVTLWEMFSYGFQPWPALTGQQILEAIDDPNYQRLEQPECCPKEYYALMLKCWQHDTNKRPKFSDIYQMLPECKPEQVQAIQDSVEISQMHKIKKDWLTYKTGDIITVLDKRPLPDSAGLWKGVLNSGKTGLFNPAHTVAYLTSFPTSRVPSFSKADSKNGLYSSKRRLRTDMISRPQGDFKHTGHVGLDGAFFGDISFLGEGHNQLPRQIVTPYKPQDDKDNVSPTLTTLSSDSSDRIPLLKTSTASDCRGGSSSDNWSEIMNSPDEPVSPMDEPIKQTNVKLIHLPDHEYQEITEEEELINFMESPRLESLDLGPSLMDEVFGALSAPSTESEPFELPQVDGQFVLNEIQEISSRLHREISKKKHALVKPISAKEQHTLDNAIAIAKELATKSLLDLDIKSDSETPVDSPKTPTSPFKKKFSFKIKTSPKQERRNFSEEAESIPDIQDIITEEAKEAYDLLVEKGPCILDRKPSIPPAIAARPIETTRPLISAPTRQAVVAPNQHQIPASNQPVLISTEPEFDVVDSNPLRMLRSGVGVIPKIRGNKQNGNRLTTNRTATLSNPVNGSKYNSGSQPPLPQVPRTFPRPYVPSRYSRDLNSLSEAILDDESPSNPLPLPPRDRTKPLPVLKHHQRKHPLILPGYENRVLDSVIKKNIVTEDTISVPDAIDNVIGDLSVPSSKRSSIVEPLSTNNPGNNMLTGTLSSITLAPPPKPSRTFVTEKAEDTFEAELQPKTEVSESDKESQFMYRGGDHVSCEDLLEFALDKPNIRRTQGRSRGVDSDEVRIMQKVLANEKTTPDECLDALNETDWDTHRAIKYMRLQRKLAKHDMNAANMHQTLAKCNWDVGQAANYLLATNSSSGEDRTTEV